MKKITGAEAIIKQIKDVGTEYVFGIAGASLIPLIKIIEETPKIQYISTRHEQIAIHMADGYARYSGKPGVVFVTRSAGSANTIVGAITAYSSDSPVLIIAGDVPTENFGKGDYQEFDIVNMFKPITKYSNRIEAASNISYFMQKALRISLSGRQGPVFLSIPGNFMKEKIQARKYSINKIKIEEPDPKNKLIQEVLRIILNSEYPTIIAGNGVIQSNASTELLDLSNKFAIPVVPCQYGPLDIIPTNHSLFFQDPDLLPKTDTLIAIGTNFADIRTWAKFNDLQNIVQIEIDPFLLGKVYSPDLGINADIKTSIKSIISLNDKITEKNKAKIKERFLTLHTIKKNFEKIKWPEDEWNSIPIKPWRLIKEIRENFNPETIIVHDSGSFSTSWMRRCMDFYVPKTCYCCLGGIMGFALPGALGIKLSAPEKDVVAVVGDGSFMMVPSSLITSVQYNIPITVIINDNSVYMQIKRRQTPPYTGSNLVNPDFVSLAESMNIKGKKIENPEKLGKALKWSINENRKGNTTLLDVITTSETMYATPENYFKTLNTAKN